ncbi:MAG: protein-disulfide reductase DsbD family protein [Alphaproteobacteria bacterium]
MRFLLVLSFLLTLTAQSFAAEPPKPREDHVQARLYSPVTGTGNKETVPVAMELKLQSGWDTYWRTPGDAGLPPALDWKGSENFTSAALKFPVPQRQVAFGLDNIIYLDKVTFPIDIAVEKPGEALKLKVHVDLLVCNNICVPEKHDLTLDIPSGEAKPSEDALTYQKAMEKLPRPTGDDFHFDRAWLDFDPANKNYVVVQATSADAPPKSADLFAEHDSALTYGKPAVSYDAKTKIISFRMEIHSNDTMEALKTSLSKGPFTLTYAGKDAGYEGTIALSDKPADAPPLVTPHRAPIVEKMESVSLKILLFALLGGLILNLMPCVLPVLSLKVLSVVSHGGKDNKKTIFRNFMASSAGIIVSFWMIAGALVALKSAGESIGWGIQFQHPWFLVMLTLIVLFFAANMWGLFEVPLPRFIAKNIPAKHEHEPTLAGHFLTGVFATLLATPCSAPFLGTAIGFALSRGAFEIFTIFTFLGLGLALPYIALALSPRLFKYMPKPGKWMVTLKKVLAAALLVTALWLASVIVTLQTMPALDDGWEKLDQAAIPALVQEGKVVVVDVTADWCLTCKANKKFVLDQPDIVEAMSHDNIVRMQADWTSHDESVAAYLRQFGRYGIPFNVIYGPGAPEGISLPELLTKKDITDALDLAAGE